VGVEDDLLKKHYSQEEIWNAHDALSSEFEF
jgi:hypothetical protein